MTLFSLLSTPEVNAKEYENRVLEDELYDSGLGFMTPEWYVFNKNAQLLYKKKGLAPDLVKHLKNKEVLESSNEQITTLSPFLPENYDFNESDYTIVLIRLDNYDACKPCKKHEDMLLKIHEKLAHKNINAVQIIMVPSKNSTTIMVPSEDLDGLFN